MARHGINNVHPRAGIRRNATVSVTASHRVAKNQKVITLRDEEADAVTDRTYIIQSGFDDAGNPVNNKPLTGIILDQGVLNPQLTGHGSLVANTSTVARRKTEDHTVLDFDNNVGA